MSVSKRLAVLPRRRAKRQAEREAADRAVAVIRRAAAVCLGYPDDALIARLPLVAAATRELPSAHAPAAATFEAFIAHLTSQDPYALAADYVATFDQRNRNSLYLTWWTAGDTRNRGTELVGFLEAYRAAGMTYGGEELPDHLTVVLEFASTGDPRTRDAGTNLLSAHCHALTRLHASLAKAGSAYAPVIDLVLATTPEPPPAP
ncbi:nitrate reductase molybdenum cofactor assembly chaperone, partial [Actinospica durhamensis]